MTKRQEQAANTKQRLLDYGMGIINDPDVESVDIKTITSACNVSTGTFYHYFATKQDYLSVLACFPVDKLNNDLIAKNNEPIVTDIREYVRRHFAIMRSNSIFVQAAMLGSVSSDDFNEAFKIANDSDLDYINTRRNSIETRLQESVDSGELSSETPLRDISQMITSLLVGVMVYRCASRDTSIPDEHWENTVSDMILAWLEPYMTSPAATQHED